MILDYASVEVEVEEDKIANIKMVGEAMTYIQRLPEVAGGINIHMFSSLVSEASAYEEKIEEHKMCTLIFTSETTGIM